MDIAVYSSYNKKWSNIVYVSDTFNNRIVKIDESGKTEVITEKANPAVYRPEGLAVDSSGNVYFTEPVYHRVRKISASSVATPAPAPAATDLELQSGWVTDDGTDIKFNADICVHGDKTVSDYQQQQILNKLTPSDQLFIKNFPLTWTIVTSSSRAPISDFGTGGVFRIKGGSCSILSYTLPYQSIKDNYRSQKRLDIEIGHAAIAETNKANNKLYCAPDAQNNVRCSTTVPLKTEVKDFYIATSPSWYITARGVQYGVYVDKIQSGVAYVTVTDNTGKTVAKSAPSYPANQPDADPLMAALKAQNLGFSIKATDVQSITAKLSITREY